MANFSYEVFSKVVERGTLAKAAAELNVTPSAVSHSVSQLETELGFPLLIRNRTGVALTERRGAGAADYSKHPESRGAADAGCGQH